MPVFRTFLLSSSGHSSSASRPLSLVFMFRSTRGVHSLQPTDEVTSWASAALATAQAPLISVAALETVFCLGDALQIQGPPDMNGKERGSQSGAGLHDWHEVGNRCCPRRS